MNFESQNCMHLCIQILYAASLKMIWTQILVPTTPSPMQYVIGQVFVKYAWEILAWRPEIYPSANFSMVIRYSDSKLPVKINIKIFLKVLQSQPTIRYITTDCEPITGELEMMECEHLRLDGCIWDTPLGAGRVKALEVFRCQRGGVGAAWTCQVARGEAEGCTRWEGNEKRKGDRLWLWR